MLTTEKYYDFSDVLIKASVSGINSRSKVDLRFDSKDRINVMNGWRPIPVMSANMDTITDIEMAFELAKNNWIAVLHKFVSIPDIKKLFDRIDSFNKENAPLLVFKDFSFNCLVIPLTIFGTKSCNGLTRVDNSGCLFATKLVCFNKSTNALKISNLTFSSLSLNLNINTGAIFS